MQKDKKKKKIWKKDWKTSWKTKWRRSAIVLLAGFFVLLGGCARKTEVQLSGIAAEDVYETTSELSKDAIADTGKDESANRECDSADKSNSGTEETERQIYVHICGAVKHPGVYPMAEGTRVYEAVALAGGFLPEADEQWLNQAAVIGDAQKLYVYSKEETSQMETEPAQSAGNTNEGGTSSSGGADLVNLNTASKEELMMLPGIGEAKAEAILQYRMEHGTFSTTEELLQISGIKEGVFSRMKDRITVR